MADSSLPLFPPVVSDLVVRSTQLSLPIPLVLSALRANNKLLVDAVRIPDFPRFSGVSSDGSFAWLGGVDHVSYHKLFCLTPPASSNRNLRATLWPYRVLDAL